MVLQQYPQYSPYGPLPMLPVAPPRPRMEQATTIRNDVNLKKDTMRFQEDDASRLYLEFMFDANTPCAITVCYCAVEHIASGSNVTAQLTPLKPGGPVGVRRVFPKGLGQSFSQALCRGDGEFLDVTRYAEHDLTNVPAGAAGTSKVPGIPSRMFPIIVVLESAAQAEVGSVTPAGPEIACGNNALATAGLQANTVHLQITYAALEHHATSANSAVTPAAAPGAGLRPCKEWTVRPLKQKIRVNGMSYELQEIYGIDGGSKPAAGSAAASSDPGSIAAEEILQSGSECVVCLEQPRDTTVLPCRHMCMCTACAEEMRLSSNKCPVCRTVVQSMLRIRVGPSASAAVPPPVIPTPPAGVTSVPAQRSGPASSAPAEIPFCFPTPPTTVPTPPNNGGAGGMVFPSPPSGGVTGSSAGGMVFPSPPNDHGGAGSDAGGMVFPSPPGLSSSVSAFAAALPEPPKNRP